MDLRHHGRRDENRRHGDLRLSRHQSRQIASRRCDSAIMSGAWRSHNRIDVSSRVERWRRSGAFNELRDELSVAELSAKDATRCARYAFGVGTPSRYSRFRKSCRLARVPGTEDRVLSRPQFPWRELHKCNPTLLRSGRWATTVAAIGPRSDTDHAPTADAEALAGSDWSLAARGRSSHRYGEDETRSESGVSSGSLTVLSGEKQYLTR